MTDLPTLRQAIDTVRAVADASSDTLNTFLADVDKEGAELKARRSKVRETMLMRHHDDMRDFDDETEHMLTTMMAWHRVLTARIDAIEGK